MKIAVGLGAPPASAARRLSARAWQNAPLLLPSLTNAADKQARQFQRLVDEAHVRYKDMKDGKNADYIPILTTVPSDLFAVVIVEFFVVRRQSDWDVSALARGHWAYAIPWALGFLSYQAINAGTVTWWASWWASSRTTIGFVPATWMSASLLSFAVAATLTLAVSPLVHRNR